MTRTIDPETSRGVDQPFRPGGGELAGHGRVGMDAALRFDNIGLAVTDLTAAVQFYRRLGFEAEGPVDGAAALRNGVTALYVFATPTASADAPRRLEMEGNAAGIDHISFAVDDVDAVAGELQEDGITIESGPENQDWGRRTVTILDPGGNRIWFLGPLRE
jgi:methylmalonyl-CoA/ethylmalonyl-CoA epimerase